MRSCRFSYESVACDFCGHDNARLLFTKEGRVTRGKFSITQCRRCGLVYVNPRICRQDAVNLYGEDYYHGKGFDDSVDYVKAMYDVDTTMPLYWLAEIERLRPCRAGDCLLDVGCGLGTFLTVAEEHGYRVAGVETSEYACGVLRARGKTVHCGELQNISLEPDSFDVITAIDVVEHLYAPNEFFGAVYRLLRDGGLFFYSTENFAETIRKGTEDHFFMPEGHLYYFTAPLMRRYLRRVGFVALNPALYPIAQRRSGRLLIKMGLLREGVLRPKNSKEKMSMVFLHAAMWLRRADPLPMGLK